MLDKIHTKKKSRYKPLGNVRDDPKELLRKIKIATSVNKKYYIERGLSLCTTPIDEILARGYTGFCDICGIDECKLKKGLALEHCHNTGKFRGWVCYDCNTGLARFYDDPELIEKALHYLRKCEIKSNPGTLSFPRKGSESS